MLFVVVACLGIVAGIAIAYGILAWLLPRLFLR